MARTSRASSASFRRHPGREHRVAPGVLAVEVEPRLRRVGLLELREDRGVGGLGRVRPLHRGALARAVQDDVSVLASSGPPRGPALLGNEARDRLLDVREGKRPPEGVEEPAEPLGRVGQDESPERLARRQLVVQEVPLRKGGQALCGDTDRNRDAHRLLEVDPDGVEGEVHLDDLARPAARHEEAAADLEREPLLGPLHAGETVDGLLRLPEAEPAEESGERRRIGVGSPDRLLEVLVEAVLRRGRRPGANRLLEQRPPEAGRLGGGARPFQRRVGERREVLEPPLLSRGPGQPSEGRQQQLTVGLGVEKGILDGILDDVELLFGEERRELRQIHIRGGSVPAPPRFFSPCLLSDREAPSAGPRTGASDRARGRRALRRIPCPRSSRRPCRPG